MALGDADYTLVNGATVAPFTQDFDGVHTIRVGLNYNFGW